MHDILLQRLETSCWNPILVVALKWLSVETLARTPWVLVKYGFSLMSSPSLADPELQRRGAKFYPKFLNDLFRRFPTKFQHFPPKIFIYLSKFLMTFFLVIDLSNVRMD